MPARRIEPGDTIERLSSSERVIETYTVEPSSTPGGKTRWRSRSGMLSTNRWRYESQLPGNYRLRKAGESE